MAAHYPEMTDIHALVDDIERELGFRTTEMTVYKHANMAGLRKRPVANHDGRAERRVNWSREPEMQAWMEAHDHGQRSDALGEEFRQAFGFTLSRAQITLWRQVNGRQTRRSHSGGRPPQPVGTEVVKRGYVYVKVREEPTRRGTKDNWVLKNRLVWEREHGMALPRECNVVFADHDNRNFDPQNLVAVPRAYIAELNTMEWANAEQLEACVAIIRIRRRANELDGGLPRTCAVCGRKFYLTDRQREVGTLGVRTCPECLGAHHKWKGDRSYGRVERG